MKRFEKLRTAILAIFPAVMLAVATGQAQVQPEQQPAPQEQPGQQPGQQEQPAQQDQPGQQPMPQEQPGQQFPGNQSPAVKEDFSDETLEKFVDINKKLAPHQQQGEAEMVKAIEDQGLEAERFGEIMTARQLNDSTNAGASDEELEKVDAAAQEIMGIQQELQQKMTKVIVDEGMELQEFQEIILAYQYSPKVQKKINDLLQEQADPTDAGAAAPVEEPASEEQ